MNEEWKNCVRANNNIRSKPRFDKKLEKKSYNIKIHSPANIYFFEQSMMALKYEADKHFKKGNFHETSVLYREGYTTTTNVTSFDHEEEESIRQLNIIFPVQYD